MPDVIAKTKIQEDYGFDPLATITRGYVRQDERGYYISLNPLNGPKVTFFLEPHEVTALEDAFESTRDDTNDMWPDEKEG
jgi:hypothetical protein